MGAEQDQWTLKTRGRIFSVQGKPVTAVGYVLTIKTHVPHFLIYLGVSAHAAITDEPDTPGSEHSE